MPALVPIARLATSSSPVWALGLREGLDGVRISVVSGWRLPVPAARMKPYHESGSVRRPKGAGGSLRRWQRRESTTSRGTSWACC